MLHLQLHCWDILYGNTQHNTTFIFPSMTSSPRREIDEEGRLDESYVQDAFHSYLKSSLAQAKAEHLLDVEVLSGAEGDLMITGTF